MTILWTVVFFEELKEPFKKHRSNRPRLVELFFLTVDVERPFSSSVSAFDRHVESQQWHNAIPFECQRRLEQKVDLPAGRPTDRVWRMTGLAHAWSYVWKKKIRRCLWSFHSRPSSSLPKNRSAIIVVFGTVLHETETIHVAHERFPFGTK